jgi:hypothetical protein
MSLHDQAANKARAKATERIALLRTDPGSDKMAKQFVMTWNFVDESERQIYNQYLLQHLTPAIANALITDPSGDPPEGIALFTNVSELDESELSEIAKGLIMLPSPSDVDNAWYAEGTPAGEGMRQIAWRIFKGIIEHKGVDQLWKIEWGHAMLSAANSAGQSSLVEAHTVLSALDILVGTLQDETSKVYGSEEAETETHSPGQIGVLIVSHSSATDEVVTAGHGEGANSVVEDRVNEDFDDECTSSAVLDCIPKKVQAEGWSMMVYYFDSPQDATKFHQRASAKAETLNAEKKVADVSWATADTNRNEPLGNAVILNIKVGKRAFDGVSDDTIDDDEAMAKITLTHIFEDEELCQKMEGMVIGLRIHRDFFTQDLDADQRKQKGATDMVILLLTSVEAAAALARTKVRWRQKNKPVTALMDRPANMVTVRSADEIRLHASHGKLSDTLKSGRETYKYMADVLLGSSTADSVRAVEQFLGELTQYKMQMRNGSKTVSDVTFTPIVGDDVKSQQLNATLHSRIDGQILMKRVGSYVFLHHRAQRLFQWQDAATIVQAGGTERLGRRRRRSAEGHG